jgi:sulfonate transport system substrate-binding protein
MIERRTFLASAAAGLTILAGCGPSRNAKVLRVGDQKGGSRALLTAAGMLNKLPYEIEWSNFSAGANIMEVLSANAVDVGAAGDASVILALAGNFSSKIVGALRSNPASIAILVLPNSPLRTIPDLKGRTVGTVRGSTGHLLILAALRRAGMPLDAADIRFLAPSDATAALQGGSIDAWATWEPFYAIAESELKARTIVNGSGLFSGSAFTLATQDALSAKPDLIRDFVRRYSRALEWALANQNLYAEVFSRETGLPVDIARTYVQRVHGQAAPLDRRLLKDEQDIVALFTQAGVIPHAVDIAGAVAPGFSV